MKQVQGYGREVDVEVLANGEMLTSEA